MKVKSKSERVDSLIDHLWQHGYLTLSRKFGKYLPAPPRMGEYEIDAVARYKKKIALGITASDEDLNDPAFLTKLDFLANYQARFPQYRVTLFLGVPYNSIVKASLLISSLDVQTQKHIKVVSLSDSTAQ